jgi:hypothetical protein
MNSWEDLYRKLYLISPKEPSKIVVEGFKRLKHKNCKALDIGCGKGRNSAYAATLGCDVDSVDLVDVNKFYSLNEEIRSKIKFNKQSVMDFDIKQGNYQAVIATRIFQYISPEDMHKLIKRIGNGLTKDGLLMMNYTASGGLLDRDDICIEKYHHTPSEIIDDVGKSNLIIELIRKGSDNSNGLSNNPMESYEILAKKI